LRAARRAASPDTGTRDPWSLTQFAELLDRAGIYPAVVEANPPPPGLVPQPGGGSPGPGATSWRDLECPGCGHTIKLRATENVGIEWERLPDGRYLGSVIVLGEYYEYEVDRHVGTGSGWEITPSTVVPWRVDIVHECGSGWGGGGSSGDREPLSPAPPPRALPIDRDLLEPN
jgi:hypothetical protein